MSAGLGNRSGRPARGLLIPALFPALWAVSTPGWAQTAGTVPAGALTQLVLGAPPGTYNQLEQLSAIGNQAAYNLLLTNHNGVQCNVGQSAPTATCGGLTFITFTNIRALIESANELLNNGGATFYSLHTSMQGLGFALRWTAGENLLAPGSATTQFANGQQTSVTSRLAAVRMGVTGFTLGGFNTPQNGQPQNAVAGNYDPFGLSGSVPALGGGASADDNDLGLASRWGGFFDAPYGWGSRAPSVLEDAYNFDSRDFSAGADYRFSRRLVAGASVGYTDERVDFDPARSIAGGGFRTHGFGFTLYGQYDWDGPYVTGSLGYQRLAFHETRKVTYPSFNIAQPSADATADGSSTINNRTASASAGWVFGVGATSIEPFVSAEYRWGRLEGFTESSSANSSQPGTDLGEQQGYGLTYGAQTFHVLDVSFGVSVQHALITPVGVLVPFVRAEYHHDLLENSYAVTASYATLPNSVPQFNLPADPIDASFFVLGAGLQWVLPHGVQVLAQFDTTNSAPYVVSRQAALSVRKEL